MRVHFTDGLTGEDRYCDRPVTELALEAVFAPLFYFLIERALRGGWSH